MISKIIYSIISFIGGAAWAIQNEIHDFETLHVELSIIIDSIKAFF